MIIRAAREEDAAAMARVMVDTYPAAHRNQMPAEVWAKRAQEWTYEMSEQGWRRTLRQIAADASPHECIYVAEAEDGDLVGLAMGGPAKTDALLLTGEVYALYVRASEQGLGLGRCLVQAVAAHLAERGMTALQIACLAANAPARNFYEAIGGRLVGERLFDEEGVMLPEVVYGWADTEALVAMGSAGPKERNRSLRMTMPYDPTIYQGSAAYYAHGRPPYSRALVATLAAEVGLDGSGRLLDVGCGPGVLAIALAEYFAEVIALDPDAAMLAEGTRRAVEAGVANIGWVQALAEDIPTLDLGCFKLVTFGQSFHWTDRERVAEAVYDLLEPGGALALIAHVHEGRPQPHGPGEPPIPHDAIRTLIDHYLGSRRRAGQGFALPPADRYEDALARTRFGAPRQIFCPGRPDIVQDIDGVLANYFSTSFAAPHLFGERRAQFEADLRAELAARSTSGLFWDWPGDTAILLANKPKE